MFALLAAVGFAQTQTARLQGTVQDSSGAVVPGAKVTAVNDLTQESSEATSNRNRPLCLPGPARQLHPAVSSIELPQCSGALHHATCHFRGAVYKLVPIGKEVRRNVRSSRPRRLKFAAFDGRGNLFHTGSRSLPFSPL